MSQTRRRLEDLGARLDALTSSARASRVEASPELQQSLWLLRQQWDDLREDTEAVEMLDGEPGDKMTAAVERSLLDLETACAEAEARFGLGRAE